MPAKRKNRGQRFALVQGSALIRGRAERVEPVTGDAAVPEWVSGARLDELKHLPPGERRHECRRSAA
jgi:hypothetical protein